MVTIRLNKMESCFCIEIRRRILHFERVAHSKEELINKLIPRYSRIAL